MSNLARMVRHHRIRGRLTQQEAADKAGLSLATWQSLERETVDPRSFKELTLSTAAHALGVSIADVFAWAERELPDVVLSEETPPESAPTAQFETQMKQLADLLATLATESAMSYMLVYGMAIEMADHLVRLHTDPPSA